MEFVVITLLLIVVILQIVILANQQKNGKLVQDFTTLRSKNQQSDQNRDRFRDRKDNNFRNNRKNQQDSRQRPPAPAQPGSSSPNASVENVEKSLRDINLKLKNAERDQEVARRKMQENIGNDHSRPRHHRDGNRDRGGKDGNRDHRRGDRHNRNSGNWRNRNNQERGAGTESKTSAQHPAADSSAVPETQQSAATAASVSSLPDLSPVDFEADLEHGRKFQVKRRLLQEDLPGAVQNESAQSSASPGDTVSSVNDASPAATSDNPEISADEISFGRR